MKNAILHTLMDWIGEGKTPYHTIAVCARELKKSGFVQLGEGDRWHLERGGRYFFIRDGSAMVAFSVGMESGPFRIVASHTDSPCLKIKGDKPFYENGYLKWNVERYGGGLLYSFLDIPLVLAGREVSYDPKSGEIVSALVTSEYRSVIPSLAIHFNRDANSALSLNAQTDMQPILSLSADAYRQKENVLGRDLYLVNAAEPYLAGAENELLVSPRLDNLVSVFASLLALTSAKQEKGISMILLADNEEVGNRTKQGAASDILSSAVRRICTALGEDQDALLAESFLVSCDGAHAVHPNHPEKSDAKNPVVLGGGVVIKHHAGQNYTTDGFSEAVFKAILKKSGIPYQDFYMRADMPCGSTLGATSSAQLSVRSLDIGIAQLAMHSATETMGAADCERLFSALLAFFEADLSFPSYDKGSLH